MRYAYVGAEFLACVNDANFDAEAGDAQLGVDIVGPGCVAIVQDACGGAACSGSEAGRLSSALGGRGTSRASTQRTGLWQPQ